MHLQHRQQQSHLLPAVAAGAAAAVLVQRQDLALLEPALSTLFQHLISPQEQQHCSQMLDDNSAIQQQTSCT
jgi:hypothetical protein